MHQSERWLFKPAKPPYDGKVVLDPPDHKETFEAVDDYPVGEVLPIEDTEDGGDDDARQEEG